MKKNDAQNQLIEIRSKLKKHTNLTKAKQKKVFFKNCQNDIFLGIAAPDIKKIAKTHKTLSLPEILDLMRSSTHEERSLANEILRCQYSKGDEKDQTRIYQFYIKNKIHIRDWDGVDDSAPYIVGAHLLNKDKKILYKLAKSKRIWDRRIAIVSTWWFIRNHHFDDTLSIAEILLQDTEDLIHKASGWMLRELGKKDLSLLKQFLNQHHKIMPRTMLRYAIEKFSPDERKKYMAR